VSISAVRHPLAGPEPVLPGVLVTVACMACKTSGVQARCGLPDEHAAQYAGRINWLVVPCVSRGAYERIQRWN
jgi:hypothetical protein